VTPPKGDGSVTPRVEAQDQVHGDKPGIYTMRQLNQQTAFVIDQIEKNGPALITRLGRFVARITPLRWDLEARVLSEMAQEIGKREPSASPQVNDDKPVVYTMRQLGQQTAFVMDQIEKNGAALITRHGHFVALITPLSGEVEARVLSEMAREIGRRGPVA
jgi:antitoxin (DNA-binding transcriptional repressor) of toxin-antitoxin stability system